MKAIQKIFHQFYDRYKQEYNVSGEQKKVAGSILKCRTSSLGFNSYRCDECGHTDIHYNSCRNRHCPCCQAIEKEIWADKRRENTIDTPYFHLVFTIPEQLRMIVYNNRRLLYSLMYESVRHTLLKASSNERYLGAQIGFFSILHTWSNDLRFHPHIHCVVMAGGLTKTNNWLQSSKKFFIPVRVLSKLFQGFFLSKLKMYYNNNQLRLDPGGLGNILDICYSLKWYVYSGKTFSNQSALVGYLSRYTHRIAISNYRIISINSDTVTISVRKNEKGLSSVTMKGVEFIRRFLMHVLPRGFIKIRSYGLLSNRNIKTKLALCRRLTSSRIYHSRFADLSRIDVLCCILGRNIRLCSVCRTGNMVKVSNCAGST